MILGGDVSKLFAGIPDEHRIASYKKREDGTPAGPGYFGEIMALGREEQTAIELPIEADVWTEDGLRRMLIPLIVPTLTLEELAHLVDADVAIPTEPILQKAVNHAAKRIAQGRSVFATLDDHVCPPSTLSTGELQMFQLKACFRKRREDEV